MANLSFHWTGPVNLALGLMEKSARRILTFLLSAAGAAALAQPRDKCDAPSEYPVFEQCGRQEVDKLDAKLNASPRDLTAALKGKTADLQQLVVAQRAWLQYREKTCGFGGARVQFNVPWCFANITQKRVDELTHMAECEREGGGKC